MSIRRAPGAGARRRAGSVRRGERAGRRHGPAVTCGTTLTKSTTLTADLVHCPGDGAGHRRGRHHRQPRRPHDLRHERCRERGHRQRRPRERPHRRRPHHGLPGQRRRDPRRAAERRARRHGPPDRGRRRRGRARVGGDRDLRLPRSRVIGNDVSNDVNAFQADGADVLDSPGSVVRGTGSSATAGTGSC